MDTTSSSPPAASEYPSLSLVNTESLPSTNCRFLVEFKVRINEGAFLDHPERRALAEDQAKHLNELATKARCAIVRADMTRTMRCRSIDYRIDIGMLDVTDRSLGEYDVRDHLLRLFIISKAAHDTAQSWPTDLFVDLLILSFDFFGDVIARYDIPNVKFESAPECHIHFRSDEPNSGLAKWEMVVSGGVEVAV